jgi:hypothetical protein
MLQQSQRLLMPHNELQLRNQSEKQICARLRGLNMARRK